MSDTRKRTPSTYVLTGLSFSDGHEHLPPQAETLHRLLVELSSRLDSRKLPEEEVVKILTEKRQLFKSRQKPERILAYYRSLLVRRNLMVVR